MKKEIRSFYNLAQLNLWDINSLFSQIADRLDKIEGLRGTPKFYANLDMTSNKITQASSGTAVGEVIAYPDGQIPIGMGVIVETGKNPAELLGYGTWEES